MWRMRRHQSWLMYRRHKRSATTSASVVYPIFFRLTSTVTIQQAIEKWRKRIQEWPSWEELKIKFLHAQCQWHTCKNSRLVNLKSNAYIRHATHAAPRAMWLKLPIRKEAPYGAKTKLATNLRRQSLRQCLLVIQFLMRAVDGSLRAMRPKWSKQWKLLLSTQTPLCLVDTNTQ